MRGRQRIMSHRIIPDVSDSPALRFKGAVGDLLFGGRAHRMILGATAAVMVFHRVDDRLKGNPITCTVDQFRRYCDFFAQHFNVVPVSDLVRRLHDGRPLGGCLSITFDDGYLDNYEVAAPELEKRGLPATFFIASGLVNTQTQPWWDEEWNAPAYWMSWSQVRELHARGFEIGAHTVSHADLARVTGETAWNEILGSKHRIEDEIGREVSLFSYPYGGARHMIDENRELVRAAGFTACFSAYGGLIRPGTHLFRIPRVPITQWHVSPGHVGFELLFRA